MPRQQCFAQGPPFWVLPERSGREMPAWLYAKDWIVLVGSSRPSDLTTRPQYPLYWIRRPPLISATSTYRGHSYRDDPKVVVFALKCAPVKCDAEQPTGMTPWHHDPMDPASGSLWQCTRCAHHVGAGREKAPHPDLVMGSDASGSYLYRCAQCHACWSRGAPGWAQIPTT